MCPRGCRSRGRVRLRASPARTLRVVDQHVNRARRLGQILDRGEIGEVGPGEARGASGCLDLAHDGNTAFAGRRDGAAPRRPGDRGMGAIPPHQQARRIPRPAARRHGNQPAHRRQCHADHHGRTTRGAGPRRHRGAGLGRPRKASKRWPVLFCRRSPSRFFSGCGATRGRRSRCCSTTSARRTGTAWVFPPRPHRPDPPGRTCRNAPRPVPPGFGTPTAVRHQLSGD